jgi:hypothetical protein
MNFSVIEHTKKHKVVVRRYSTHSASPGQNCEGSRLGLTPWVDTKHNYAQSLYPLTAWALRWAGELAEREWSGWHAHPRLARRGGFR